jgi:hypothetical protein
MAKRNKQRPAVGMLGKQLTRRSKGKCELCESRDGVRPFELWPFPEEPELDRTLFACERCRRWLERGEIDPVEAHFLETAVWSNEPAVKLAAARLLVIADFADQPWLRDAVEANGIDPEIGEFIEPAA